MGLLDFFRKKRRSQNASVSGDYMGNKEAETLLESIIGCEENPVKVEKEQLADGSIYTGEAILCTNGYYLPNGFGKKIVSEEVELTGNWKDGNVNGVCYMNMHFAMVTGHFVKSRPLGWCLSVEGGRGVVFGVFKKDDCVKSLGDAIMWMVRSIDLGVKISSKKKEILIGEIINNQAKGFMFLNNGDVYVGTDNSRLDKTGFFFKFTGDGYVQIGEFNQGTLVSEMTPKEVIEANGISPSLLSMKIDTGKKYF